MVLAFADHPGRRDGGWGRSSSALAIHPLKNASLITLIIITLAGSILFRGIAMFLWGKDPYTPALLRLPAVDPALGGGGSAADLLGSRHNRFRGPGNHLLLQDEP